ncbi:MAG TPA: SUMF1/EgtB/PvdO family nonheme iron enzyme [Thermoanaerobaculia bacterium]|nr:SUMF1/EgtB/PvdO family nonheme iron enzyme [Thermoanaerobaculia bacterium]
MSAVVSVIQRKVLVETYLAQRRRTRTFFDGLDESVYFTRPIALRNPFVFYEGHLPAFVVNTLIKRALGRSGVDERLEVLFARGIDPEDEAAAGGRAADLWPSRSEVLRYAERADALVVEALENEDLVREDVPCLVDGEAVRAILEHEVMHQETLLYMAHRLPYETKRRLPDGVLERGGAAPAPRTVRVPAGTATLGASRVELAFAWDNERPRTRVAVEDFAIAALPVTNGEYLELVRAGGPVPAFWERDGEGGFLWRGMKQPIPLPLAWPVFASGENAAAYARFRGRRLPTEAEWHRAAYGTPSGEERAQPWGEAPPDASRAHLGFAGYEPVPAGSRPLGASAWGVLDLVGNGWEWTSTPFDGFPGFEPLASYPNYSADFFDGKHSVLKGASPATDVSLVRRSFRNWFRPEYPYVYAKFRLAGEA